MAGGYPIVVKDANSAYVDVPLVKGYVNTSFSSISDGTRVSFSFGQYGSLRIVNSDPTNGVALKTNNNTSDGKTLTSNDRLSEVISHDQVFNERKTTFERKREPSRAYRLEKSANTDNDTLCKTGVTKLIRTIGYTKAVSYGIWLHFYDSGVTPVVTSPVLSFFLEPAKPFNIDISGYDFNAGLAYRITKDFQAAVAVSDSDLIGLNIIVA